LRKSWKFLVVGFLTMCYIWTSEFRTQYESYYSSYKIFMPVSTMNCTAHIRETKQYLERAGLDYACKALEEEGCAATYDLYTQKADPLSVFLRSSSCDIDWPEYTTVSQEELKFPLAYFITAYTDARNLELMLATIFRPHNSYCVHIDPKSDQTFTRTVKQLLYCYRARYPGSYIHTASRSVPVVWGHYSIVEAELICLKDLIENNQPWSYAIDMAGSEVMLLTNKELVANLSSSERPEIYTGSYPLPEEHLNRIKYKYQFNENANFDPDNASKDGFIRLEEAPDPIPYGLTIYKGAKSYRLPRQFVDFLLSHPVAAAFLEWSKTTQIPDEMVVPTLARISSLEMVNHTWVVEQSYEPQPNYRFAKWDGGCHCGRRNGVCVFCLKDLSTILKSGGYIINKVRSDFEPFLAECLIDVIRGRNNKELKSAFST